MANLGRRSGQAGLLLTLSLALAACPGATQVTPEKPEKPAPDAAVSVVEFDLAPTPPSAAPPSDDLVVSYKIEEIPHGIRNKRPVLYGDNLKGRRMKVTFELNKDGSYLYIGYARVVRRDEGRIKLFYSRPGPELKHLSHSEDLPEVLTTKSAKTYLFFFTSPTALTEEKGKELLINAAKTAEPDIFLFDEQQRAQHRLAKGDSQFNRGVRLRDHLGQWDGTYKSTPKVAADGTAVIEFCFEQKDAPSQCPRHPEEQN